MITLNGITLAAVGAMIRFLRRSKLYGERGCVTASAKLWTASATRRCRGEALGVILQQRETLTTRKSVGHASDVGHRLEERVVALRRTDAVGKRSGHVVGMRVVMLDECTKKVDHRFGLLS